MGPARRQGVRSWSVPSWSSSLLNRNRIRAGRPQLAQPPAAIADLTRVVDLHFEYREHAVQFGESTNRVLESDCATIDA
jgi:hypothetical protein